MSNKLYPPSFYFISKYHITEILFMEKHFPQPFHAFGFYIFYVRIYFYFGIWFISHVILLRINLYINIFFYIFVFQNYILSLLRIDEGFYKLSKMAYPLLKMLIFFQKELKVLMKIFFKLSSFFQFRLNLTGTWLRDGRGSKDTLHASTGFG